MSKPSLWTPPKKLSGRVKELACQLFISMWQASFADKKAFQGWDDEKIYRRCLAAAEKIVAIEGEEPQ